MAGQGLQPVSESVVAELEKISAECGMTAIGSAGKRGLAKGFALAKGIECLRRILVPEVMAYFLMLKDTKLGFVTDEPSRLAKGDKPYGIEVVKNCLIEATLRGLMPINNEFNIIAGNCYTAKNGLARLVREFPGMTDLVMVPCGIRPGSEANERRIGYTATWKLNGVAMRLDRTNPTNDVGGGNMIVVRQNSGMGADALLGKAERKMLANIYAIISGAAVEDGDINDDESELKSVSGTVVGATGDTGAAPTTPAADAPRRGRPAKKDAAPAAPAATTATSAQTVAAPASTEKPAEQKPVAPPAPVAPPVAPDVQTTEFMIYTNPNAGTPIAGIMRRKKGDGFSYQVIEDTPAGTRYNTDSVEVANFAKQAWIDKKKVSVAYSENADGTFNLESIKIAEIDPELPPEAAAEELDDGFPDDLESR